MHKKMHKSKTAKWKKAQVRMSETVAILFVFFVLLIFGIVFYSRIERHNIDVKGSEIQELQAVEVAQTFVYLPEIQCTKENIATNNCLDMMKLDSFSTIARDPAYRPFYLDILLRSRILVNQTYPQDNKIWLLYDSSNDFDWRKKTSLQIPVSLFNATGDPLSGKSPYYAFGIIQIEIFS